MFVCWHMRWSVERDFMALSTREQNDWLAWAHQQQIRITEGLREAYTPNEEGKLYSEIVTPRLLALAVTSGGLGG